jgi:hypothetical protein
LSSKDRSKEILREIQSLRQDLETRLDRLEATSGAGVRPSPSVEETEVPEVTPPSAGKKKSVPTVPPVAAAPLAAAAPLHVTRPGSTPHDVSVVVRPLVDLSLARAVESSLGDGDGIDRVRLVSLSGDAAVISAAVQPGVSVVSTLRRDLQVAFDVTESSNDSVTIELARPETEPDSEREADA